MEENVEPNDQSVQQMEEYDGKRPINDYDDGLKRKSEECSHYDNAKQLVHNVKAKQCSSPWINYFHSEVEVLKKKGDIKISQEVIKGMADKWRKLDVSEKAKYHAPSKSKSAAVPMKQNLKTRCCPERLWSVAATFSDEKKKAVEEIGFASFIHGPIGGIDHKLILMLVDKFDHVTSTIEVHDKAYKLTSKDAARLLGLNEKGSLTRDSCSRKNIEVETKHKCGFGPRGIAISDLEAILQDKARQADDEFKVLFTLFLMGTTLSPTSSIYVKQAYLQQVINVGGIVKQDWASWAFNLMVEGVRKYKECNLTYISGCVLILQLFYLDVLLFRKPVVDSSITPICAWGDKDIKLVKQRLRKRSRDRSEAQTRELKYSVDRSRVTTEAQNNPDIVTFLTEGMSSMKRDILAMKGEFEVWQQRFSIFEANMTEKVGTLINAIFQLKEAYTNNIKVNATVGQSDDIEATNGSKGDQQFAYGARNDVEAGNGSENDQHFSYGDRKDDSVIVLSVGREGKKIVEFGDIDTNDSSSFAKLCDELMPNKVALMLQSVGNNVRRSPIQLRTEQERKRSRYARSPWTVGCVRAGPFPVPKNLPKNDKILLEYVFDPSLVAGEVIVETDMLHYNRQNMRTFRPDSWLDTYAICLAVEHMTYKERQEALSAHGNVIRFGKKWDLITRFMGDLQLCKKIFIPMHDNDHWFLLIVYMERDVAEIWDPYPSPRRNNPRKKLTKKLLLSLDKLLATEIQRVFGKCSKFASMKIQYPDNIKQQINGYDCGVYVIKYMDDPSILQNYPWVKFDIVKERMWLALELVGEYYNKQLHALKHAATAHYNANVKLKTTKQSITAAPPDTSTVAMYKRKGRQPRKCRKQI